MSDVAGSSSGGSSSKNKKKKISVLVADSDELIRRIHKILLEKFGLEVEEAIHGREAICAFREGLTFDIVFMAQQMPVIDGCTATRTLRGMGVKSMIIGLYGGRTTNTELEAFKKAGLDDCIQKPLTEDKVKAILEKLNE